MENLHCQPKTLANIGVTHLLLQNTVDVSLTICQANCPAISGCGWFGSKWHNSQWHCFALFYNPFQSSLLPNVGGSDWHQPRHWSFVFKPTLKNEVNLGLQKYWSRSKIWLSHTTHGLAKEQPRISHLRASSIATLPGICMSYRNALWVMKNATT